MSTENHIQLCTQMSHWQSGTPEWYWRLGRSLAAVRIAESRGDVSKGTAKDIRSRFTGHQLCMAGVISRLSLSEVRACRTVKEAYKKGKGNAIGNR